MAKKPVQETFDVFKQKKIAAIERAADKFDELRDLIAKMKGDLTSATLKLKEAIHKNLNDLDRQETAGGEQVFKYVRGDYRVALKLKEEIAVKIGEESKEPTTDTNDASDEEELEVEVQE